MKQLKISLLVLIIVLSSSTAAAAAPAGVSWYAQYYNNRYLEGHPAKIRHETTLDYNWGTGAPVAEVGADNFSVRWTTVTEFAAGDYTFSVTVDDGVRVWIDGAMLIDEWREQAPTTYTAPIYLTGGVHQVQVAYFEATGTAIMQLNWQLDTPTGHPGSVSSSAKWQAEYFSNPILYGPPFKTITDETAIDFDWQYQAPLAGMPFDNFSVRWTANIETDAGTYVFSATVDDGARVWIDGDLIIDAWREQPPTTYTAKKELSAGTHRVQMAYFEATGMAQARLSWWIEGHTPATEPGQPAPTPSSAKLLIDNLDENFIWGGSGRYRHVGAGGQGGSFYYTQNTVFFPENYAKWQPVFKQGGRYEVFVYIPATFATSTNVRYRVLHNGQRHDVKLNQAQYSNQWVSLGAYTFKGDNAGKEFIVAYDNTREPYAGRTIGFDAVKLEAR